MPSYFTFVRHGETFGNREEIAHGQWESPLTDLGLAQAQRAGRALAGWQRRFHRVYASPLSRALETGRIVAEALELPLHEHAGLMEGSLGDWEGITYEQLGEVRFAEQSIRDDDFRGHNGESPRQLAERMTRTLLHIRQEHPNENIVIVSHGAAIAHGLARMLNTRPLFGHQYIMTNAGIAEVEMLDHHDPTKPSDGSAALKVLNYKDHLTDLPGGDGHGTGRRK